MRCPTIAARRCRRICTAATAAWISRCSRFTSRRRTTSRSRWARRSPPPARLGTVVGACATDTNTSNDATCLDAFIKKFGARALRRPLAADEVDVLHDRVRHQHRRVGRRLRRPDRPVRHRARVHVLRRAGRQRGRRADRRLRRHAPRARVTPLLPAVADGARRYAAGRRRRRQPAHRRRLRRAGDAPARRRARAPGAGRVLRRLDEGRGPARDGREERGRDVQDVRGRRPARREAAPGDDRRRGRDARLLHLDDAVARRCAC